MKHDAAYYEAEALYLLRPGFPNGPSAEDLAKAQVHATLALAAATEANEE